MTTIAIQNEQTYRGWDLEWTGWKTRFCTIDAVIGRACDKCGKTFASGDLVRIEHGVREIFCAACDGQPNYVMAQWVAFNAAQECLQVCAGNKHGLIVRPYKPGDSFPVEFDERFTTSTPQEVLDVEREKALLMMKSYIDGREDG